MTSGEARALVESCDEVTIEVKGGASWTGRVIGFIDSPAVIIGRPDGHRVVVAISGASVVARERAA